MSGIRNVHIDGPLSSFASAYESPEYFADRMAPIVLVDHVSDEFHKRRREDLTTPHDDVIAADGEANRSTFRYVSDTYQCKHRALVDYLSNTEIADADSPLNLMEDATATIMNRLLLNREIRVAALYANAANYATGNSFAAGAVWTDQTNGNPLNDLQTARRLLAPGGSTNRTEVALICDEAVWDAIAAHTSMRGGGALSPVATRSEVMERLRIDKIYVSDAEKNTANEGQPVSHSPIWDATRCWIARVPVGGTTARTSAFAATFRFRNGLTSGGRGPGVAGVAVRRWDAPEKGPQGSQAIQPSFSDDEKSIQNDQAVQITGVRS